MSRLHALTAGVALAAVVSVAGTAEAGSRKSRICRPGGWYKYPAATRYYAPPAAPAMTTAPSNVRPPAAAGSGVVRRYSYEPGADGAAVAPAPVVRPAAPVYRPSAPAARSSGGGGFKAGLTGGDRLRPGTRNR